MDKIKLEKKLINAIQPDLAVKIKKRVKWVFIMLPLTITFIGVIPFIIFSFSFEKYNKLERLMSDIKEVEKRRFDAVYLKFQLDNDAIIRIVAKLIETGNLEGYEIIGGVGIAKKDLRACEDDFIIVPPATAHITQVIVQQPKRTNCAGCGAPITHESGRFCKFCGTKL